MKKVILFMAGILASMMLNAQSRWSVTPEAGLVVNKENYSKTNIPESLEISIFPCRGANLEWMHNINLLTAIHMVNLHA